MLEGAAGGAAVRFRDGGAIRPCSARFEPGDHVVAADGDDTGSAQLAARRGASAVASPRRSSTPRPRRAARGRRGRARPSSSGSRRRQSALDDDRHRGGRRDRACGRRASSRSIRPWRRRCSPPARARRRHRDAFGDEISERPFRRDRRRARAARRTTNSGSASQASAHGYGAILGPFEAYLLMRGMRTLHLRVRARSPRAAMRARRAASRPSRTSRACSIRACRAIPATRSRRGRCAAASAACCRSASAAARRRRSRPRRASAVEARDLARRRREPDRAPRLGRRRGHALPARSAAPVGRPRGSTTSTPISTRRSTGE